MEIAPLSNPTISSFLCMFIAVIFYSNYAGLNEYNSDKFILSSVSLIYMIYISPFSLTITILSSEILIKEIPHLNIL